MRSLNLSSQAFIKQAVSILHLSFNIRHPDRRHPVAHNPEKPPCAFACPYPTSWCILLRGRSAGTRKGHLHRGSEYSCWRVQTEGPGYWERNTGARGEFESIVSDGNHEGADYVTVRGGEFSTFDGLTSLIFEPISLSVHSTRTHGPGLSRACGPARRQGRFLCLLSFVKRRFPNSDTRFN